MRSLPLLLLFLSTFLSRAEAAQFLDIDTTQLLRCVFSSRHHNRIAISGKRIKKVFCPEGDVVVRQEEESGQVFVQSLVERPPVTTISIVSNDGIVQDIELHFEECSAEILILTERREECLDPRCCIVDAGTNPFDALIAGVLNQQIPDNYISFSCDRKAKQVKKGVILRRISKFIGENDTAYLLGVENVSRIKQCIQESDVNILGGDWVYLQKRELCPGEKTFALVGRMLP
jgi:hypothetical protein